MLRRLKPKHQVTMGEHVTKAGRDEVWLWNSCKLLASFVSGSLSWTVGAGSL